MRTIAVQYATLEHVSDRLISNQGPSLHGVLSAGVGLTVVIGLQWQPHFC